MVLALAPSILPQMLSTRWLISEAARRENVISKMRRGSTPLTIKLANRCANVLVLPDPAPAMTSSGAARPPESPPTPCSTARRCSIFRLARWSNHIYEQPAVRGFQSTMLLVLFTRARTRSAGQVVPPQEPSEAWADAARRQVSLAPLRLGNLFSPSPSWTAPTTATCPTISATCAAVAAGCDQASSRSAPSRINCCRSGSPRGGGFRATMAAISPSTRCTARSASFQRRSSFAPIKRAFAT